MTVVYVLYAVAGCWVLPDACIAISPILRRPPFFAFGLPDAPRACFVLCCIIISVKHNSLWVKETVKVKVKEKARETVR